MATLTTHGNVNGTDGLEVLSGVVLDAAGNPTTLTAFNGSLVGVTLIADATGNLLGEGGGGANNTGTIFLLAKTAAGFAATPTVLANNPAAAGGYASGLVADDAGNLFGVTSTDTHLSPGSTVFELARAGSGYATTQTTLTFLGRRVVDPAPGRLVLDAAGNVFGITSGGDSGGFSSAIIFEIPRSGGGYASTPTTLVQFPEFLPSAFNGLTMDSAGDLFGTAEAGGANGRGTIFELTKTGGGYASAITTLTSFNGTSDGSNPVGTLLIDAAGNMFGTTATTVFELARSGSAYSATLTTLATFNGANGGDISGGLVADQAGNLFGTTAYGGIPNGGTIYELTNTGFVAGTPVISGTVANQPASGTTPVSPFAQVVITDAAIPVQTLTVALSSAANGTLGNTGAGSYNAATGIYTDTGSASAVTADLQGLVFNPAASNTNVTSSFTIIDTDSAGGRASDGATSVADITTSTIGLPVYRFYDPASEGHFFTSDAAEVSHLQNNSSGLVLEGPAFSAVNPANDPAAVTVYRFYQTANGSHFYTDSQQEVQQVLATRPDLVLEGPAFSVDPTMQPGDTAVYRFYETRSDTHLYTADAGEIASIKVNRPDVQYEGPAFYIKA